MSVEIIIKKLRKDLDVGESAIMIGDLRQEMAKDMLRVVEGIINSKQDLDDYYILVYAKGKGKKVTEKIVIMRQLPVVEGTNMVARIVGTICFYINNRNSTAEVVWVLPRDIPMPDEFIRGGTPIKKIDDAAKVVPIRG